MSTENGSWEPAGTITWAGVVDGRKSFLTSTKSGCYLWSWVVEYVRGGFFLYRRVETIKKMERFADLDYACVMLGIERE